MLLEAEAVDTDERACSLGLSLSANNIIRTIDTTTHPGLFYRDDDSTNSAPACTLSPQTSQLRRGEGVVLGQGHEGMMMGSRGSYSGITSPGGWVDTQDMM